jgi:predicted nucleotidyltransferase
MLRYAGRRGVTEEVRTQIGKVDSYRVEMIGKIQCTLAKQPVVRAWLFGSWSRMEERPDSDIDLLVIFDDKANISLLDHIGFQQDIEEISSRAVDMVTNGTLLPFAEKTANNDKYIIYERSA